MTVIRYWTATNAGDSGPRIIQHEAELPTYERLGYKLAGPFVLAPTTEGAIEALELAQTALHKLCLDRGSTDGYGHVFEAINAALALPRQEVPKEDTR